MTMQNRATVAKARWDDCEIVGRRIRMDKRDVHRYLWSVISSHEGWLEKIKEGDEETIARLKETKEYKKAIGEGAPRIFKGDGEQDLSSPVQQIKLAMWFIDKIGSPRKARRILNAAIAALEALDEEEEIPAEGELSSGCDRPPEACESLPRDIGPES